MAVDLVAMVITKLTLQWTSRWSSIYHAFKFNWHLTIWQLSKSLRWRHNGRDGVWNHQPHDCLLKGYSDADQTKHQSSTSLASVRGIHQGLVNSPRKWPPVTRKMFPIHDVIMFKWVIFVGSAVLDGLTLLSIFASEKCYIWIVGCRDIKSYIGCWTFPVHDYVVLIMFLITG